MRTTLDIDEPVLKDLKRMRKSQGRPLGRIVSDLLAQAMARTATPPSPPEFRWHTRPMGARVNLADRDAVYDAMERRS